MFPLNPDLARLLVGFRMDDELRRADHDRLVAEARRARRALRTPRDPAARPPVAAAPRPLDVPDVTIVEAHPSHREALLAFLGNLSSLTAYYRFATRAAPADVVDVDGLLTNDACSGAVLALHGEEIVGHAQAVASPGGTVVELAVVVADEWQGRGIGPRLVGALLGGTPAATAGELELFVLPWNTRARRLIKGLWPDAVGDRDGDLLHYRVRTAPRSASAVLVPAGCHA